jgi:hypothetical protein
LPPLKSTIASITAAADRALDPLLDLVAAVPPPRPNPEPRDYIGILHADGVIEAVSEPDNQTNLAKYRDRVILETDGAKSVIIVAAWMKPPPNPDEVPVVPRVKYRKEWCGWDDWLGSSEGKPKDAMTFHTHHRSLDITEA